MKTVCVYCASSTKIDPAYTDAARTLGTLLGSRGIRVVNGAGNMGLMGAVSDAALAAGGRVTGVIPRFMVEQGWHHTGLNELLVTESMHDLPGGCGTLEELLEAITWKQLGLYLNPIVILNLKGYYDPLLAMFDRAIGEHFMGVRHAGLWQVARSPQEAVELAVSLPRWDASIRKFAAL